MENILKVENTYTKLSNDQKKQYEKKLRAYIKREKDGDILNKKEARYLLPEAAKHQ